MNVTVHSQRVLIGDITSRGSGSTASLRVLLDFLDRTKYTPELLFGDRPNDSEWLPHKVHRVRFFGLHNYDFFPASWSLRWLYQFLKFLLHFPIGLTACAVALRRIRPAIVHVNGGQGLVLGIAAKIAGFPVVWHLRELLARNVLGWCQDWIYAKCSERVMAVSSAVAGRVPACRGKLDVVYNGVNPATVDMEEVRRFRARWGIAKGDLVLLLIAHRISIAKGYAFLAAVGQRLMTEPGIKFVLAGYEPHEAESKLKSFLWKVSERRSAREIHQGWNEAVTKGLAVFTGFVKPEVAIAASSVVVCPNVVPEPFGRTVIEAISRGKPVIAANLPAFTELVVHGSSGWLLPLDADEWCRLILELRGNASMLSKAGREALKRSASFGGRQHAARVAEVYDRVLNRNDRV